MLSPPQDTRVLGLDVGAVSVSAAEIDSNGDVLRTFYLLHHGDIEGTLGGILEATGEAREVVILGPSTPYIPAAFLGTPVTLLAGSVVLDLGKARRVISEGGGTRTMGKALSRWVARA